MSELDDKISIRDETPLFSLLYHALADYGILAHMTGNDFKTYGGLKRFANFTTQRCFPSVQTLIEITGVSQGSIYTCIEHLINFGLVVRESGGGRGNPNEYVLTTPDKWKQFKNCTVSENSLISGNSSKTELETVQKLNTKEIHRKRDKEEDMIFYNSSLATGSDLEVVHNTEPGEDRIGSLEDLIKNTHFQSISPAKGEERQRRGHLQRQKAVLLREEL